MPVRTAKNLILYKYDVTSKNIMIARNSLVYLLSKFEKLHFDNLVDYKASENGVLEALKKLQSPMYTEARLQQIKLGAASII